MTPGTVEEVVQPFGPLFRILCAGQGCPVPNVAGVYIVSTPRGVTHAADVTSCSVGWPRPRPPSSSLRRGDPAAMADLLEDDVIGGSSVDLQVGGPDGAAEFWVDPTGSCDIAPTTGHLVVNVVISNAAVASVSPSQLTFSACEQHQAVTITPWGGSARPHLTLEPSIRAERRQFTYATARLPWRSPPPRPRRDDHDGHLPDIGDVRRLGADPLYRDGHRGGRILRAPDRELHRATRTPAPRPRAAAYAGSATRAAEQRHRDLPDHEGVLDHDGHLPVVR